mgnify:CR=1 FL=1
MGALFGGEDSAFSTAGLSRSAAVLLGYAPAVWIYGLTHVLNRALYARGDTSGPTRFAIIAMSVNLALILGLFWVLGEAGLARGLSVAVGVAAFAAGAALSRSPELGMLLRRSTSVPVAPVENAPPRDTP